VYSSVPARRQSKSLLRWGIRRAVPGLFRLLLDLLAQFVAPLSLGWVNCTSNRSLNLACPDFLLDFSGRGSIDSTVASGINVSVHTLSEATGDGWSGAWMVSALVGLTVVAWPPLQAWLLPAPSNALSARQISQESVEQPHKRAFNVLQRAEAHRS
jgi:hypothetical protein